MRQSLAKTSPSICLDTYLQPTSYNLQHRKKQKKRDKQVDFPNTVLPKLICGSLECSSIKIDMSYVQILLFQKYLQDMVLALPVSILNCNL